MMRLSVAILTAALVTGSLVACSNGYGVPPTASSSADSSSSKMSVALIRSRSSAVLATIHEAAGLGRADAITPGIYASGGPGGGSDGFIYGYPANDSSNGPPVCSVGGGSYPSDIAVDQKGDLLVADRGTNSVIIFAGPGLCGSELGSITDPYGVIEDVASRNAARGTIVVANAEGLRSASGFDVRKACCGGHGSVSVCTLSGGCTANLKTRYMRAVAAVALAPNGDCWASGVSFGGPLPGPSLAYFAHCRGRGVLTTGFEKTNVPWALDIDESGNLVVVGEQNPDSSLWVYSGCNPACTHVGGPFTVNGEVFYGHLDANSKHLVLADWLNNQLDVYSYSTTDIKYEYSISNGLPQNTTVSGAAFSPSSKE